jgi:hypothetical protein
MLRHWYALSTASPPCAAAGAWLACGAIAAANANAAAGSTGKKWSFTRRVYTTKIDACRSSAFTIRHGIR